ncbi:MAG: DUF4870 domain-containing protein [Candidatus Roizmanbacteria bacterium]
MFKPAPQSTTSAIKGLDIVIPSREMKNSVQTLPDFLRDEARHIVRTGKSFYFQKKHIENGLIHLSFLVGLIVPFAHVLIPYIVWKIHQKNKGDLYLEDAMLAFNFQLTCTIYMVIFVILTTGIGLMSFPFIKELSGVASSDRETPLTVMVPTVLAPALSIYFCVWVYFSLKVAIERMKGKRAQYPTSISFLSIDT